MKPDWIAPNRAALIVIDCQVDFGALDGEMARRGADMTAPQAALAEAETLADAARQAGALLLQLTVTAGNARAQDLYKRMGFRLYGTERRALRLGDRFYDEELMALDLG